MTRYFFDFRDESGFLEDNEGLDFVSLDAAKNEAAQAVASYARDMVSEDGVQHLIAVEVRTASGPSFVTRLQLETITAPGADPGSR